ncbi:hypothetical protein L249_5356 [Ophiocordyceps polyrhachis-furcata BCC 54312]|uniref:Proteophosphoglycan 5 n=1 Tax=Ophiocordyceps polyrhachis-furcata BCC 54312 TaxID=1330021 RepID=A0A367L989_9HYPO|nr:hypothetical protein L249_5356 [Ophiocordyceps polyrhachis-furcata BCC 54312]
MDRLPSHIPSMPQNHGRKAYASENDAASLHQPQTPNKPSHVAGSPMPASSKQQQTGKSSNKKKARARNTPTSPDSMQRQTPPHGPLYLKPAPNRAAFAGATFHASPAPSALPIPSFVTRSSSDSPLVVHAGAREDATQEPSPPATDTDAPTPLRASSAPRSRESPLDFMFRAHREEKERSGKLSRAASSSSQVAAAATTTRTRLQSQAGAKSSPNLLTTSSEADKHVSRTSPLTGPEPDGLHGLPMGPAFSTPYQERMKAARSDYARRPPPQARRLPDATSNGATPPEDPTEALKKFLFGTPPPTSKNQPSLATPTTGNAHRPQLRKAETLPPEPSRSHDIQAMENDLRRILKLDLNNNHSHSNHHNPPPR